MKTFRSMMTFQKERKIPINDNSFRKSQTIKSYFPKNTKTKKETDARDEEEEETQISQLSGQ